MFELINLFKLKKQKAKLKIVFKLFIYIITLVIKKCFLTFFLTNSFVM